MPLTRQTVTAASKIMLPLYPFLFIPLGLAFILQPASRTSGPSFDVARHLMPIEVWGCIFLVVGLVEVLALIVHRRQVYLGALTAGAGLCTFWMVLILAATIDSPMVSYTSGWWLVIPIGAHIATARSLALREH